MLQLHYHDTVICETKMSKRHVLLNMMVTIYTVSNQTSGSVWPEASNLARKLSGSAVVALIPFPRKASVFLLPQLCYRQRGVVTAGVLLAQNRKSLVVFSHIHKSPGLSARSQKLIYSPV